MPPPPPLRAGYRVSLLSLLWSLVTGSTAIGLGLAAGSPTLLGFGAIGLLDGLGSAGLVLHFRHALRHHAPSQASEQVVLRIVITGLAVTGLATMGLSAYRLLRHWPSAPSAAGMGLTAGSCLVLSLLARHKVRVSGRAQSRALRADGWVSLTGAALAAVALAGTGLNASLGLGWVDAAAAIVVAAGAVGLSVALARAA